jgi:hypothetical protein
MRLVLSVIIGLGFTLLVILGALRLVADLLAMTPRS